MKDALHDIRGRLNNAAFKTASQVQSSLALRLLQVLEWEVWNPREVSAGLHNPGPGWEERMNIVLSLPPYAEPQIYIEIREPGTLAPTDVPPGEINVPFYVLTDGLRWRFFYMGDGSPGAVTALKYHDVTQDNLEEVDRYFRGFLTQEAHKDDKLRHHLEKKRAMAWERKRDPMRKFLSKAQRLGEESPNTPLRHILLKLVRQGGYSVTMPEVQQFLKEVEEGHAAPMDPEQATEGYPMARPVLTEEHLWVEPTTGMEFIWTPPCTFLMGSPEDESGRNADEGPVHRVSLDGYWLARYPVTLGQWRAVMEAGGRADEKKEEKEAQKNKASESYPVEEALYEDALDYIEKLNRLSGEKTAVRLPTEAEWECAARAGTNTRFPFVEGPKERLDDFAWYVANSKGRVQPVGKRRANSWGFYDMLGNTWEWVADSFSQYGKEPVTNPKKEGDEAAQVRRGGSSRSNAKACRPARRNHLPVDPDGHRSCLGFRLARSGPPPGDEKPAVAAKPGEAPAADDGGDDDMADLII